MRGRGEQHVASDELRFSRIATLEGMAESGGTSKLMPSVAAKYSAAQKFFERAGFETTMHEMLAVGD